MRFNFFRRAVPAATRVEPQMPRAMAVQSGDGGKIITTPDELERFLRDGDSNSTAGARVTPDTAMRVAAVYGCVRIISGKVATLPIDIKRKVDDRTREDASDHPLSILLRRKPNGWMKPAQFKRMLTAQILLRGNCYCRKVRGVRGDMQSLLPLHPDRVTVRQLPSLALEYDYQPPNGGKITFRQDDVFHLMGMTLDGISGVSVLKYARETVGLALATARHGATFFKNGTQIGSKIEHPNRLGKEGLEFLHASLDQFRSGGDREAGTIVLEEGAKFERLGMTMEDAAFVDTMKLTRGDIAMFFGVPPHMLGDTDKATSWGTGIEQQSLGFVAYTLEDWLTAWEEGVNGDLVRENEPDIYARFNRNALVRGDIKTRWEAYVKGLQWGVRSPNEVRALEDENPREGGDIYYPPPNTAGGTSNNTGDATGNEPGDGSMGNEPSKAA